jgi:hypothetical protein
MSILYVWFLSYITPAIFAGLLMLSLPKKDSLDTRKITIAALTLVVSFVVSQYFIIRFGLVFPYFPDFVSIAIYIVSIVISFIFVGPASL